MIEPGTAARQIVSFPTLFRTVRGLSIVHARGSLLHTLPQPFDEAAMHWSADGRSVVGVTTSAGHQNRLRMDIATAVTTPITRFSDSQTLFDFAIDRGGRLAIARGETSYDIVLIRRQ